MAQKTPDAAPPAYLAASLFTSTLDTFVESVPPTTLDRHVLSKLSGGDYSSLISGLRFLGLVEPSSTKVRDEYKTLVKARREGTDAYKAAFRTIIDKAYKGIVGGVDLQHGTLSELEKAFRDAGVPAGQMLIKSVRFYIKALQECGVALSPHITKPRQRSNGGAKAADAKKGAGTKKAHAPERQSDGDVSNEVPRGLARLPIPGIDGAFIQYPVSLSETDFALFEAILNVLRTYVQSRKEAT